MTANAELRALAPERPAPLGSGAQHGPAPIAKRRIMLYCAHPASAGDYLLVADALAERDDMEPVLTFISRSVRAYAVFDAGALERHRVVILDECTKPDRLPLLSRLTGHTIGFLDKVSRGRLATLHVLWRQIAWRLFEARAALDAVRPDALLITGDRRPAVTLPLLEVAAPRRLPAIIYGSAILGLPVVIAHRRSRKPATNVRGVRAAIARCLPTGLRHDNGRSLLFYEIQAAAAMALHGIRPRDPWSMGGSGLVQHVAVHCEEERASVADCEVVGPDRVTTVGQPSLDWLAGQTRDESSHARRRREVQCAAGLDDSRPLAIFVVPQRFSDAPNYEPADLCGIVQRLVAEGYSVLCSIHPKTPPGSQDYIAQDPHVAIASGPLASFVDAGDVMLGSYSSTIPWPALLGHPVAVVDLKGEHDVLYAGVKSLPILRCLEDVSSFARNLLEHSERVRLGETLRQEFSRFVHISDNATGELVDLVLAVLDGRD